MVFAMALEALAMGYFLLSTKADLGGHMVGCKHMRVRCVCVCLAFEREQVFSFRPCDTGNVSYTRRLRVDVSGFRCVASL